MHKTQFIILAAGKGTRMNQGKASAIPKVLYPIAGQPMISYILHTLKTIANHQDILRQAQDPSGAKTKQILNFNIQRDSHYLRKKIRGEYNIIFPKPIIVVGYKAKEVIKKLGQSFIYARQTKRLGTGHAAKIGFKKVPNGAQEVFILQGDDSAFYSAKTLKTVIKKHRQSQAVLTFLTTKIAHCQDFGRVIRDNRGKIIAVVEKDNLTPKQAQSEEINCGSYLLNYDWAKENLTKIKKHYKSGREYPLPDIIKIAISQKKKVNGLVIDRSEWVGVNSPQQLEEADRKMRALYSFSFSSSAGSASLDGPADLPLSRPFT